MTDQVPAELIAGDTWSWTRSLSDYPAPDWSLTYHFVIEGSRFDVSSSDSGSAHAMTVTASDSAGKKPGRYRWTARAINGATKITVDQGWVEILPDPAKSISDPRAWAARTLAAIEAFLEGNATTAQSSMTVNGRSLSRWSIEELMKFRDKLKNEVRGQENAGQGGKGRVIKVRFKRA